MRPCTRVVPCGGPIAVDSTGTVDNAGGGAIAIDPSNDDLYVASGSGTITRSVGGGPAEPFAEGAGSIKSLAVDASHNVYVDEGNQIVELNSSGTQVGVPIGARAPGQLKWSRR